MVLGISDIPILLVIAGVGFIFIAIVREVSGYIKTSIDEKKAKILGIAGIILLASGLITATTGVFQSPEIKPTPTPPVTLIPTPTPTPTLTPTPTPTPLSVAITYPSREASSPNKVEGTVSKALKEGEYMWIAVNPFVTPGEWWPQTGGPIKPSEKTLTWEGIAYIGEGKQDIGKECDIGVLIVDDELNSKFKDWLRECEEKQDWPPITKEKIQKGVIEEKIFDRITVVLREVK